MSKYLKRYWKRLTLLLVLALVVTGSYLVIHPRPSGYKAVQNGMTLRQVHDLLGPSETQFYTAIAFPDHQPMANGGIGYEEWESLEGTIQVFYDPRTGLVTEKMAKGNELQRIWRLVLERLGL